MRSDFFVFNLACPCKYDHGDFSSFFISFGEIYHRTDRTLASKPYRVSFCNSCDVSKQASIIQNHRNNSFLGGIGTPCPCCPSHAQACAPRSGSQGGGFDDCERDGNNDGGDNDDDIGNNDGSADGEGEDKGYPTHTQMCPPSSGS